MHICLKIGQKNSSLFTLDEFFGYESILQSNMQVFFVYEMSYGTSEDDDQKNSIVFFHPREVSNSQRCMLSCQLVGTVQFFKSCLMTPTVIHLEKGKFAVQTSEQFIVALGGSTDMPGSMLKDQLHHLMLMFQFFYQSIEFVKKMCGEDRTRFLNEMEVIWKHCLHISQCFGDILSLTLSAIPYLNVTKLEVPILLEAYHLVNCCQECPGVISGSVFYRENVICTYLPLDITKMLLVLEYINNKVLTAKTLGHLKLPPGVSLIQVYLTKNQLISVLTTVYQGHSAYLKIVEHGKSQVNNVTSKESTFRSKEYVSYSDSEVKNNASNKHTKKFSPSHISKHLSLSDNHVECWNDISGPYSELYHFRTKPGFTNLLYENGSSQVAVDVKEKPKLKVRCSCLVEALSAKQEYESQNSLSDLSVSPVLKLKKQLKLQVRTNNLSNKSTFTNNIKISQNCHKNKMKLRNLEEHPLNFYVSNMSDRSLISSRLSLHHCVQERKNIGCDNQDFLKIDTSVKPLCAQKDGAKENVHNSQNLDVCFKYNNSNFQTSVTEETSWSRPLLTTHPHLSLQENLLYPINCNISSDSSIDIGKNKLSLHHLSLNTSNLDSPTCLLKRENSHTANSYWQYSCKKCYRYVGVNEQPSVPKGYISVSPDEGIDKDYYTYSEKGELYPLTLYIQKHCEMVMVLLLDQETEFHSENIQSLWNMGLSHLGNLEVTLKQSFLEENQSFNKDLPVEHEVVFDIIGRKLSVLLMEYQCWLISPPVNRHILKIHQLLWVCLSATKIVHIGLTSDRQTKHETYLSCCFEVIGYCYS
ncbi:uncharacterized protein LOC143222799 isoform X2 [Tachypleus tridentatus]|uniref:uncharacterized protein LOC143222799 isoform X2 n=1 Tax=Tachypleus tridentatus TaxID=6853 RepID=UPI003FD07BE6